MSLLLVHITKEFTRRTKGFLISLYQLTDKSVVAELLRHNLLSCFSFPFLTKLFKPFFFRSGSPHYCIVSLALYILLLVIQFKKQRSIFFLDQWFFLHLKHQFLLTSCFNVIIWKVEEAVALEMAQKRRPSSLKSGSTGGN